MMAPDPFHIPFYTVFLKLMRFMSANKKGGLSALLFAS
jgi:hypothetical protein